MKTPKFINSEKRVFVVTINEWYWYHRFPDWCAKEEWEREAIRNQLQEDIDAALQSGRSIITVFIPAWENDLITFKQVTGKKRSRIVVKS